MKKNIFLPILLICSCYNTPVQTVSRGKMKTLAITSIALIIQHYINTQRAESQEPHGEAFIRSSEQIVHSLQTITRWSTEQLKTLEAYLSEQRNVFVQGHSKTEAVPVSILEETTQPIEHVISPLENSTKRTESVTPSAPSLHEHELGQVENSINGEQNKE